MTLILALRMLVSLPKLPTIVQIPVGHVPHQLTFHMHVEVVKARIRWSANTGILMCLPFQMVTWLLQRLWKWMWTVQSVTRMVVLNWTTVAALALPVSLI